MTEHGIIAVTGGNRGIGAAITVELARRGFAVACLSRRGGLPVPGAEDPAIARHIVTQACDVTDEASIRKALASLREAGYGLRGLVSNAGIHLQGASDKFTTSEFERVLATNATAVFVTAREAYPYLVEAGGGLIVNIGSFFDKLGVKQNVAYCASKAAVGAITRCLAVEWAPRGIRLIDVAPGYVVTDLNRGELGPGRSLTRYLEKRIPTGRPATPEQVARVVASLFEENNAFLTGETIYLDGGQGIAH